MTEDIQSIIGICGYIIDRKRQPQISYSLIGDNLVYRNIRGQFVTRQKALSTLRRQRDSLMQEN